MVSSSRYVTSGWSCRKGLKPHSGTAAATRSVCAVTLALRPWWSRSAISPKWSPGPSRRWRPSGVATSASPARMTRKPTPPSPRIMISAPCGCRISRIDLAAFLSSPDDMPSKMPTGLRSIAAILLLEKARETAAPELAARLLVVGGHERFDAFERRLGERLGRLSRRAQRRTDHHHDPLSKPQVFGPRQRDRNHRYARLDGEMGKAFLEGHELALGGPVVA